MVDAGSSSLKLEIWDTAGQEKYHSVCHLYFRGANAALLVYDITRKVGLTPPPSPGNCTVYCLLQGSMARKQDWRHVLWELPREHKGTVKPMLLTSFGKPSWQPLTPEVRPCFSAVSWHTLTPQHHHHWCWCAAEMVRGCYRPSLRHRPSISYHQGCRTRSMRGNDTEELDSHVRVSSLA